MTEPTVQYRVDYWKYADEAQTLITCATAEDADWADLKIGRIKYAGVKFQLPEGSVRLDNTIRFMQEAFIQGREHAKAEIRSALGV